MWEKSSQHANHKIQNTHFRFFLRAPSAHRMALGWPPMEPKVHGMRLGWCKDWLDDSRMMGTTAQGSETWAAHVFVFFYLFLVILGLRPGQDDFPSILKIKMIILIILVWAEACKQQHMPWHAHTHSHTHTSMPDFDPLCSCIVLSLYNLRTCDLGHSTKVKVCSEMPMD